MTEFIKKILLFSFPLLLVFVLPVTVLVLGREYFSVRQVIETQKQHQEALFGFVYNGQSFIPYKQALVENRNPEIIALGTSRAMQFRKEFFIDQDKFINAGGGAKNLYDIKQFIQNLSATSSVKVVILGLDQDMFMDKKTTPTYMPRNINSIDIWKQVLFTNVRKIYIDYFHQKFSIKELLENQTNYSIGIATVTGGDGFREDGSYRYGRIIDEINAEHRVRQQVLETVSNLKYGRYASFATSSYQEKNLDELRLILELAKSRNMELIGFFPPFPSVLYTQMRDDKDFADTIKVLPESVNKIFSDSRDTFFDLSNITSFGGIEDEFVDNIHASDKMHIRMLLYLAKNSSSLKEYVDVKMLRTILESNKENILTF